MASPEIATDDHQDNQDPALPASDGDASDVPAAFPGPNRSIPVAGPERPTFVSIGGGLVALGLLLNIGARDGGQGPRSRTVRSRG